MRRTQTWSDIIRIFSNWPSIAVAKMRGTVPILKTRNGVSFEVANLNSNLLTILEVWAEKQYGEPPQGRVVDLGANIGAYSLYAASNGCSVRAYEPEGRNFALLRKNTQERPVQTYQLGVAQEAGTRELHIAGDSSGKNSMYFGDGASIPITCTTLAHILQEPCDVLKIDIEGAELEVLRATPHNILPPKILVEYHSNKDELLEYFSGFQTSIRGSILTALRPTSDVDAR